MSLAPISGRRRLATVLTAAGLATLVAAGTVLAGTPVTNGWRDHAYGGGAFRPNGDKPQSKVWFTEEEGGAVQWWAGMFLFTSSPPSPKSENRIWKLSPDKATWTASPTIVDGRDNSHADYLWDENTNTLYVMSVAMPNNTDPFVVPTTEDDVRFFKYTYNATTDAYTQVLANVPVAGTASTATPAFRGGAWTVTIDKDSSGRLWAVWPQGTQVRYSYSDTDGASWTPADQLPPQVGNSIKSEMGASAVSRSDSAAVITFGSPTKDTIGVMWSDQDDLPAATDNGYFFATIAAGADPTVEGNWTKDELPKLPDLVNNEADNHINMKTTGDGTVYMVGKTRAETTLCETNRDRPNIPFFRRTPGGTWNTYLVATVGDCDTRPQVVISEQLQTAYVFITSPNGGGAVYRRSAPLTGPDAFVFRGGPDDTTQRGVPFIKSATETLIDDSTTTKQVVTAASGIVVNANNLVSSTTPNQKFFLHNYMPLPAADTAAPTGMVTINAGAAGTTNPAVSVAVPATDNPAVNSGMSLVRLANSGGTDGSGRLNGAGATSFLYSTPVAWTLSGGEGTKTVFAQWRDAAGNWSTPISDTIVLDTTAPTGTVEINGGADMTDTVSVTLGLTGSDTGSGVASVLISNIDDFTGITPVPFAATVQHQLASGNGPKTVFVKFVDAAGNVSASSVSDGIELQSSDVTPPNPVATLTHIVYGTGQTSLPVRLTWSAGTDPGPGASGVAGYYIQRQVDGGAFANVAFVNHPTLSYTANLSTSSHTYRYRVLVKDKGRGLTSSGKYTPTFRTLSYSESNSAVKYTGSWATSSSTVYVGGKARVASASNASASLTFSGNRVGWLSRTGPTYGTARVYINGSLASTVNLFSATYTDRRIVFQRSWTSTATRSIRIVVSGTSGHPKVALDQFFVLR